MSKSFEEIREESYVDAKGVLRWRCNDRVPFGDVIAIFFGDDIESIMRSNAERDRETQEMLAEYRAAVAKQPVSDEERFEARAAFGPGVEIVNVLTGKRYRT